MPSISEVSPSFDRSDHYPRRAHNLKNIDCDIPHGKDLWCRGCRDRGKSSLAFDTVYAEGQWCYVELLSAYVCEFLERIEKPDVDLIDGLAPAIAIKQKTDVEPALNGRDGH